MANYSLVVGSEFKPFSFERYLEPYKLYAQAYREVEDAYTDLETKSNIWDKLANEATDPKAHSIYKKYSDDLKEQAGELAKNGLSLSSRQAMLNMKKRYTQDITPIENAYTRRQALIDEQRKAMAADNTIRFDNDFRNISLDALMENPSLGYEMLSGKDIAARTAAIASNYAKSIQNEPEFKSILKSQYWQVRQHSGWTPEQIIMDATGDSNAPEALKQIRQQMHDSIRNSAAYNREWADAYISQGMHSGLGTDTYSTLADQSYVNPLEWAKFNEARRARQAAEREADKMVSRPNKPLRLVVGGHDVGKEDMFLEKAEEKEIKGKQLNFASIPEKYKAKVRSAIGQNNPDSFIYIYNENDVDAIDNDAGAFWFNKPNDIIYIVPNPAPHKQEATDVDPNAI